jgi:Cu/Ag efflux pump CusA
MPIFAYLQAAVDLAATDLRQAARKHYAYLNQALQGGVAETDTYGANCVPTNVDIYPKCELPHLKQLLDGKQYDQMITKIRLILINLNISTSSWENGILEEIEEGESTINDTIAIELYHAIVRDVMEGGSSGGW